MTTAPCPECEADVGFDGEVMMSEIAQCGDCGVELEVVSIEPLKLDIAPEEQEDWGE